MYLPQVNSKERRHCEIRPEAQTSGSCRTDVCAYWETVAHKQNVTQWADAAIPRQPPRLEMLQHLFELFAECTPHCPYSRADMSSRCAARHLRLNEKPGTVMAAQPGKSVHNAGAGWE
jgi:hypothetical protein